ncbi:MAG TPA: choice-of-anchor R domain-containing protein [Verrucomicrobiota bacterium]|nr:choice-of-anchor R domain-containing protein [Verrucomicrobiota bacterium]HNU50728.1 choice-of-anchor R domain-containing protein [Verrucomicrobiota bacterium]
MTTQSVPRLSRILIAATTLQLGTALAAAWIVNNVYEPSSLGQPISPSLWQAQPFAMGDMPWGLGAIGAVVGSVSGNPAVIAQLRCADPVTDAVGLEILTTFRIPDLSGPPSLRVFGPLSPVNLNPHTAYYFLLGVGSDDGAFIWNATSSPNHTGQGEIPAFRSKSTDGGRTWQMIPFGTGDLWQPQQIEVRAIPITIPEPGVIGLFLLGCGILVRHCSQWGLVERHPRLDRHHQCSAAGQYAAPASGSPCTE